MTAKRLPVDCPETQSAIYGVALSLDAFIMNGIQYGVLQSAVFPGFLEKTAGNLMRDLASLEEQVPNAPVASQPKITELLASLRATCQQLVDLVIGLRSIKTLSIENVRQSASHVPSLRQACVQLIQELEGCFGTPKPFYQSRPAHSTTAVNDFLTGLEQLFTAERAAPK